MPRHVATVIRRAQHADLAVAGASPALARPDDAGGLVGSVVRVENAWLTAITVFSSAASPEGEADDDVSVSGTADPLRYEPSRITTERMPSAARMRCEHAVEEEHVEVHKQI
jgi:hypothetical protein